MQRGHGSDLAHRRRPKRREISFFERSLLQAWRRKKELDNGIGREPQGTRQGVSGMVGKGENALAGKSEGTRPPQGNRLVLVLTLRYWPVADAGRLRRSFQRRKCFSDDANPPGIRQQAGQFYKPFGMLLQNGAGGFKPVRQHDSEKAIVLASVASKPDLASPFWHAGCLWNRRRVTPNLVLTQL